MNEPNEDMKSEDNQIQAELAITMKYLDMLDSDHDGKFVNPILISAEHHNAITELRQSRNFANSSSDLTELDCLIMGSQKRSIDRRSRAFKSGEVQRTPSVSWKRTIKKSISDYGSSTTPIDHLAEISRPESIGSSSKLSSTATSEQEVKRTRLDNGPVMINWRAVKMKRDAAIGIPYSNFEYTSDSTHLSYEPDDSSLSNFTDYKYRENDDVEVRDHSFKRMVMSKFRNIKRRFPFQ
ncbi:hypothetical protein ACOME3_004589 [Neoechinorhynchus agilis]